MQYSRWLKWQFTGSQGSSPTQKRNWLSKWRAVCSCSSKQFVYLCLLNKILRVHSKIVIIDGQSDYFGFKLDPRMTMIRRLQLRKMNFSDLQTSREAFFEKKRGHLHDKLQNHSALHQKEWEVMRSISGPTILFNNVSEQMCDADACPLWEFSYSDPGEDIFFPDTTQSICIITTVIETGILIRKDWRDYDPDMRQ